MSVLNQLETRIKKIQKKINVLQTGVYDVRTCATLELLLGGLNTDLDLVSKKKNIQRLLGFGTKDVDGILGVNTTTKIEMFLDERLPDLPTGASLVVSKKSVDLILNSEITSKAAYEKNYRFPVWPKGESGITIGIGYDLGYVTPAQFEKDWKNKLSASKILKLKAVVGLKGIKAFEKLSAALKSVEIPFETAKQVFYNTSLPIFAKSTSQLYPGLELLPPDAQGSLLSLVYNRGTDLEGERRLEMKNIRKFVTEGNLKSIANEIRKMKRLWPDLKGLQNRRENEAILVENAKYFVRPQDYIFV